MESGSPELPQRVRYAKSEIIRALTALEAADPVEVSLGMKTLELEDRLRAAQDQAERWRKNYEAMRDLFVVHGRNPELEVLDELMRIWAAKA